MSLLAGFVRAAFPVGSSRRDRVLGAARRVGVLPSPPQSSYQRWQESFESRSAAETDLVVSNDLRFSISVEAGREDPAAVTRTLVSLTNQTFQQWTARLTEMPNASAGTRRLIADAQVAETRFRPVLANSDDNTYFVRIRFGDALAPSALMELAAAATRNRSAKVVSAEFDMIDPFSGLRSAPCAIGAWEPDLADQFDWSAGFVSIKGNAAERLTLEDLASSVHVDSVLLHRLVGPRERATSLLPPATKHHGDQTNGPAMALSPHRNGGTRVKHHVPSGTTAVIVVRDPLTDPVKAQQQLARLLQTSGVVVHVSASYLWTAGAPFPEIPQDADVVAIVDGGLTPQENGWLDDLTGAVLQTHVLAVAPILTTPSGVVFDGGVLEGSDGLAARSGRLDFAPYELARCRQVVTLSGRAMLIRRSDLDAIDLGAIDRAVSSISSELRRVGTSTDRKLLVWAHQRWRLDVGLVAGPTDSPMLAWSRGRLRTWFDDEIVGHQPEPGRIGEGVW